MGGGIMQLVAYGAQDVYLTGNPQITFFKVVYRRHTNFSMETIKQNISGQSFIGTDNINNKATVIISRNGDLVTNIYVSTKPIQINSTDMVGLCGDSLIDDVEIEIGGQRIDKHYREWNQIWDELSTPISKSNGYKYMTGSFNNNIITGNETKQERIHYPLNFWFCRNPGLALPLIALQYHEVQLKFTWGVGKYDSNKENNLTRGSASKALTVADIDNHRSLQEQHSVEVWADYIYLDTDERRRFSQVSHEYLIEQLQIQKEKDVLSGSFKLNLEHPIKEIIWTTPQNTPFTDQKVKLSINGHDRFYERNKEYFTLEQPYKYHTSIPGYNIKETEHPVLLNESIFSKDYTYAEMNGLTLDTTPGDNRFFRKYIVDKTLPNEGGNSVSQLTADENIFSFVSSGTTPNPSMEFKIGDIVRVNYYNIDDLNRTGTDGTGDITGYLSVPAVSILRGAGLAHTHPAQGDPANPTGDPIYQPVSVALDIGETGLTINGNYSDRSVENVVRNLTVLGVYKSETLLHGKTVYEIKFNDSIGNFGNADGDRVSFEIIGRVQNPVSRCSQLKKDIYVYSFALEPEEHQPSGSCNFSRIDSAKLIFSAEGAISNIYAVNYNVLRIISGMGGLAYSS